jgi:hypothetical protein
MSARDNLFEETTVKLRNALVSLCCLAVVSIAAAQPPPARVRGEIQSVDGQTLVVATPNDGVVRLALTDMTGINGLEKKSLADIGENTFIGTTAIKNRDGRWQATEVHIFPEAMRGAGEGHYAWDLPESTMTNGAATGIAAKGRNGTLTVRYAGGNVEVDVTRKTAIVGLTLGDRTLLVPGAAVMALVVPADNGLMAVAVVAETNGVKPPM